MPQEEVKMKTKGRAFAIFRDITWFLLLILIFSTIYNFWYINQQRDYYEQYIIHSTEVRVLTQEISKYADTAVLVQTDAAFKSLKDASARLNNEIDILKNGKSGEKGDLPPSPQKIKTETLDQFQKIWDVMKSRVDIILSNQEVIMNLNKTSVHTVNNLKKIKELYLDVAKYLGQSVVNDNKKFMLVTEQIDATADIINDVQKILDLINDTSDFRKEFPEKANMFFSKATALKEQNTDENLAAKFSEIQKYIDLVRLDINAVQKLGDSVDKIDNAVTDISRINPAFINISNELEQAYISYPKTNTTPLFSAYGLGLLSFIVLVISIYLFHKESQRHVMDAEGKNRAMQEEVQKLVAELPEIAGGNVPIETINNSEISKKIPESFSYALGTLRKLVYNIGKTAKGVSVVAQDAQKITKDLADSSGQQAQEIGEITASVSNMAISIELVSTNALESANVAQESVNIASEGGKVVRNTINGMEKIQTQIQETSNYMRRLSDSSQEIGEIVSLIDGIADQTNILSLNASIQAAMAGEAGKGFAVVADEVQRLAEKVSYATKEIGSLVRSIQTDTNQVIVAMEQTKTQVLEGSISAQEAGRTLEKIETVSRRLSDLIQNISRSAKEQALESGKVSHIMNDVKGIAQQTALGNMTTVDLISNLMQYVTDLRNSVLEFKLPE